MRPNRARMERGTLLQSFLQQIKSPVDEHPARLPNGAPKERDAHLLSPPAHIRSSSANRLDTLRGDIRIKYPETEAVSLTNEIV
jgi:hypothetical protein